MTTQNNAFVSGEELSILLGKEHKEVLRDTRDMLFIISAFNLYKGVEHHYKYMYDYNGEVGEILLTRNLSLILASGYGLSLRKVINDHFDKLENTTTEEKSNILYVVEFDDLRKIGVAKELNEKLKLMLERESGRKARGIAAYTSSNLNYIEDKLMKQFEDNLIIGSYYSTTFNDLIAFIQKYSVYDKR